MFLNKVIGFTRNLKKKSIKIEQPKFQILFHKMFLLFKGFYQKWLWLQYALCKKNKKQKLLVCSAEKWVIIHAEFLQVLFTAWRFCV